MIGSGELIVTRWSSNDPRHQFVVENPATGSPLATVQGGGAAEMDAAVRAARAAFDNGWRYTSAAERAVLMREAADVIRGHADEIAELETRENGKPFPQSRFMDVAACIASFEFFADRIERFEATSTTLGPIVSTEYLVPSGVVGGILPFNWPPIHFGAKVAPALAVGNCIVLKPGEQAPLAVIRLTELVASVLPVDVIAVVPGGAETGAALASHPLIGALSVTGSPTTGRRVLRAAAENLTPVLLELGGKNAFIVFDDADLDVAVADAIEAAFLNQGEACTAASRILVQQGIHDRFVTASAAAVTQLRVGDGMEPGIQIGPLVTAAQQRSVLEHLEHARVEGAQIAAQASLPDTERLAGGRFVAPTLFTEVKPEMRVAREEIFGPITAILGFEDLTEAVVIANATDFGLVAGIYSRDPEQIRLTSEGLDVGIVMVNNYYRNFLGTPFGGVKDSGFGREHAASTLAEFGYTKSVRSLSNTADLPARFIQIQNLFERQ